MKFDLRAAPKAAEAAPEPAVLSVGALTRKVRTLIESGLGDVWVEGEVSNLRRQASGHVYFTLKDSTSQVACVLFAGQAAQLRGIQFADGVQVQVFGQITVYEARGNYQIIVRRVQERGLGALQAKFEQLKRRLADEGLFLPERKRALPRFPRRIGVVTSPTGAAIHDFLNVLHRRQRGIAVVVFPVRVQGNGAAEEIAAAIRLAGDPAELGIEPMDVVVVTRGGGSLEDLWEFNEEAVARAIASCPVPVVSAIGHEIDFTISDFAADVRAPTPSAAAEILSAEAGELMEHLQHFSSRMKRAVVSRLDAARARADAFRRTALFSEPRRLLQQHRQDLDRLSDDLRRAGAGWVQAHRLRAERSAASLSSHCPTRKISLALASLVELHSAMRQRSEGRILSSRAEIAKHSAVLAALSPSAALARGYTMTLASDGTLIRSAGGVSPGQEIVTKFCDGTVRSVAE
ncbi:MAG: exodeoxyribonuclease VII large subunit [Verrucomicrobiae bacterium]